MDCHEGPGAIPGRYAGEPIRIHEGPTPQQVAYEEQRADADALAGRICAAAAEVTRSQYRLLELVGEIRDGMCRYPGCHSTRHLKAHHQESGSTPLVRVNG
jgi:hypothetical protein